MNWICDECFTAMNVTKEGTDRYRIECPSCGTYWYVDEDGEMLNDGSDWSPRDEDECSDIDLSLDEAALIWATHGKDEDYMFGYSEDELEDAL